MSIATLISSLVTTGDGGCKAQGLLVPGLFFLTLISGTLSLAAEAPNSAQISQTKKWTNFQPYIPEKKEYQIELGGMWEVNNLYWLGATFGYHLGRCALTESQKCQQYVDLTGGVGGRVAYTDGLVLAGLRWQYISFPQPFSPSARVFVGMMNIRDNERERQVGVYGVGLGFTASLHKKLDIKWENRFGGGDKIWVQSLISISLKIDRFVDYFADKVKGLASFGDEKKSGVEVESTPKTFVDWFNHPVQNKKITEPKEP